ncbi:MAG: glycosyltransferase [Parcubacteria group bacterium]
MKDSEKTSWVLYLATFPPRECGIATYTRDLIKVMDKNLSPLSKSKILAMNNDVTNIYNYPKEVILQISDTDIQEYINTAKQINKIKAIKLINIQHEFGIFGGSFGNYLIPFLEIIKKPAIITFHTVLPNPNDKLKKIVQDLANKSACLIVMTNKAVEILRNEYKIKTDIAVIPHGMPPVPFSKSKKEKSRMGLKDKIILLSFGLMNKGKGYEYVIEALPEVIKKFPDVLYLIVGETHPVVRKKEGEKYRNYLEDKVKKLGLQNNVKFYNKYLKLKEVVSYLQAADVYISSGLDPNQVTSGTLAYAMGCGRAVISTPSLHAIDAVRPDRGIIVEFKNSQAFTEAIINLLSNPHLKESMEKNAYAYTRFMTWPNVALAYRKLFNKYVVISKKHETIPQKVKLTHLMKLTDEFGVIQFANGLVPDKSTGYTLDDNARALVVCCRYFNQFKDSSKLNSIKKYLNFIAYVQQKDGRLYNYVDYARKINLDNWIHDPHGRAIWSLGYLISIGSIPEAVKSEAENIFLKALAVTSAIKYPRAVSFIILGLYFYNTARPAAKNIDKLRRLADHLVSLYKKHSSDNWQWFERQLTYSNSKLPEALFCSYLATQDEKYLKIAKSTLDFLSSVTFQAGVFAPVGQDGWYSKNGQKARFDQQPVDVASMVQTLVLAYKITKDESYLEKANTAFQWFMGKNSLSQVIYDEATGGCHDGLGKSSINLNQGAESTISYLLARLSLEKNNRF